jgi:hypothetical protein
MAFKFTYGLRAGFIGITVIAVLLGLLTASIQNTRQQAIATNCLGLHLGMVDFGIQGYHDAKGSLPPAYLTDANGKPMHSWRVLVLPYLGYKKLYAQYDFSEPWNGPHNRLLTDPMPQEYRCTAHEFDLHKQTTDFVAVVGPETAWPGATSIQFKDITDGVHQTIVLVEVANSNIHWMEPREMRFDDAIVGVNVDRVKGISSTHAGQVSALTAGGHVFFLEKNTPPETVRAMLTIAGGEKVPF